MKRLFCAAIVFSATAVATGADLKDGSYWVAALKDSQLRNEAVCRLIMRGEYLDPSSVPKYREKVPDTGCRVRRVVDATAQADGVMIVFLESEYSDDKLSDGSKGGHFLMFDAAGRTVEISHRNNSLSAPDGIVQYDNAGSQALVQMIGVSSGQDSNVSVETLRVVPTTTAQRPILSLLLATPKSRDKDAKPLEWAWRSVDSDGNGQTEFEVGLMRGKRFSTVATYRYSATTQRYEGPEGAMAGDFQRIPDDSGGDDFNLVRAFGSAPRGRAAGGSHEPMSRVSPREAARKQLDVLLGEFRLAREMRDYARADSLIDGMEKVIPRERTGYYAKILAYRIFERGNCAADWLSEMSFNYRFDKLIQEGLVICQAANLPAGSSEAAKLITEIVDARAKSYSRIEPGLYDQFARQPVINRRALELMAQFHLADTSFANESESALIQQILAGRADNVGLLLELGYEANSGVSREWRRQYPEPPGEKTFYPLPMLPLQAVRQSLATRGQQAIEIAKLLLAAGANPHRLESYPQYSAYPPADAALQAELDRLFADAANKRDPVTAEFRGYLVEYSPKGQSLYARFLVGNGSDKPLSIPAWKDGDDYLLGSLNWESHLQWRMPGGIEWQEPIIIEHGWSPSTKLVIAPGESHELLFEMSIHSLLQVHDGERYRLWFNTFPGEHHSDAFQLNDPRLVVETTNRERKRSWDIDPECIAYVEDDADSGHQRSAHQRPVIDKCAEGK